MSHHPLAPSAPASVVVDFRPDVGVLVIHTGPEQLHREIEVSPVAAPGERTHSAVRARLLPGGTVHAALYPDLRPGEYTVWADPATPAGTVTITGGGLTEYRWP